VISPTTPLLQLEAAHAGYGAATVLQGIDLQVAPGEVLGLLGRNGMGKTTLIRVLTGQLMMQSGRLHINGQDVSAWPSHRIARLGLALAPEGRQVFPNLSVREHLTAFERPAVRPQQAQSMAWNAARVFALFPQLAERAIHMGHQLSGGEQQMLAIGRALVTNPQLLILDEATEGLAPLVREQIWQALASLRAQGQAILVVDKYVQRLIALADRHVILEKGRIAWAGSSAALNADRALWQRYLGV
jgi:branched-chain amino acid transport system ATP-binding protein